MSDFSFKLESIGGGVTGYLPGIEKMANATAAVEPQESTIEMYVWSPYYQDNEGVYQEWEAAYTHTWFNILDCYTFTDLAPALYNSGYRTLNSGYEVCRFAVNDEYGHPLSWKTLSLITFSQDGGSVQACVCRRESQDQGQTWVFTQLSSVFGHTAAAGSSSYGFQCGRFRRDNKLWYAFGMCMLGYGDTQCQAYLALNTHDNLVNLIGGIPGGDEADPDFGPESQPGGYNTDGPAPTFDATSDPWVDYPKKPGIAALGLVNLYKCNVGSLVNLGAELFPDVMASTDVWTALTAFSDSIWNSKLIDYIISAHIIPIDVTSVGALEDIKVGTRTLTGILARKISDDIIEFDCGTIHVDEFYTNFIDYKGTRCRIYLPFHGMVDIKPEYWQSADLQVKYLFNVIDGSFIAQIFSTVERHQKPFKCMIGQYTGSACVHVPMTGASYAAMFSGMVANAGGMALGIAAGQPQVAATSALAISTGAMGNNGNMQMSNAYNASAGFYGHPCPYLIIERQISQFSTSYPREQGLPLLVTRRIGACSGLTICDNVILNFTCTEEEAKEIISALKEGVIV